MGVFMFIAACMNYTRNHIKPRMDPIRFLTIKHKLNIRVKTGLDIITMVSQTTLH